MAFSHHGERDTEISQEVFIGWDTPPPGWIKLNTNGGSRCNNEAACGGLLRDEHGNWLCEFVRKLGLASTIEAELWECLMDLICHGTLVEGKSL